MGVFIASVFFEPFQLNLLSIKHRISKIINPIPYNSGQGMVASLVLHRLVLVAEDEEVNAWVKGSLLLGVLVEAGVLDVVGIATFYFVFELFQAVVVRPT